MAALKSYLLALLLTLTIPAVTAHAQWEVDAQIEVEELAFPSHDEQVDVELDGAANSLFAASYVRRYEW